MSLVREISFKDVKGITCGVKRRIWAKRMRKPERSKSSREHASPTQTNPLGSI
jgi:hypothetical protein